MARAIDITSAGAPASIQERKLREKTAMRNEMREKRSEWGLRKPREKREMMVALSVQLTARKEGAL